MAQIPTSSITMRAIFNEINGTNHANGTAITDCKMSEFRTDSIAYTSGAGSSPNVKTTPDRMNEWAGYLHAQSLGTIDYGVRISTSVSSWGLFQSSIDDVVDDTASANGGLVIWRTHDATNTYIKAKVVGEPISSRLYYDGGNQTLSNSSTGTTLITIPVGSNLVSGGVTINATVTALEGTIVTYTAGTISGTGAALLVARGAEEANADPGSDEEFEADFKVELTASATGYTTTVLNNGTSNAGIICHSVNSASAESEE